MSLEALDQFDAAILTADVIARDSSVDQAVAEALREGARALRAALDAALAAVLRDGRPTSEAA